MPQERSNRVPISCAATMLSQPTWLPPLEEVPARRPSCSDSAWRASTSARRAIDSSFFSTPKSGLVAASDDSSSARCCSATASRSSAAASSSCTRSSSPCTS